jgi:hypothetical protein
MYLSQDPIRLEGGYNFYFMILKKIEFECIDDNVTYSYEVKKRVKHITNYINRNCLSTIKFKSDFFNIVVIYLIEKETISPYIVNNGLVIPISFNKSEYNTFCTDIQYRNFYYECIWEAFSIVQSKYELPVNDIFHSLLVFKEMNYKNEWIHKEKVDKKKSITAILYCSLTIENFKLRLYINIKGEDVFNDIVLITDPDEVAFDYRFNDIIFVDNNIIVTSKTTKNLLEFSLDSFKIKIFDNE